MIDFLSECNIDLDTIKEMKKKYPAELFDLNCNKQEIIKIIEYLRSIGITNINELLLNETSLFLKNKETIEKKFSRYDILTLVHNINDNYEEIEKILIN